MVLLRYMDLHIRLECKRFVLDIHSRPHIGRQVGDNLQLRRLHILVGKYIVVHAGTHDKFLLVHI